MDRPRLLCLVVAALIVVGGSGAASAGRWSIAHAASTSQEYAAVQDVIGTDTAAQTLLSFVMGATGSAALEYATVLGFSDEAFVAAQNHPVGMMDAIQRYLVRTFGRASNTTTILKIESLNERVHLLDLFGLSPQAQSRIITYILSRPLASSYLEVVGSATIKDSAGLFTSLGKSRIMQAAIQAGVNVLLITSDRQFASQDAWQSWLRTHDGNPGQITIGLHIKPKNIYVIPGADTHISEAQAQQGITAALPIFNSRHDGATTLGVVKLIDIYRGMMTH